jgi:hypothetical protein
MFKSRTSVTRRNAFALETVTDGKQDMDFASAGEGRLPPNPAGVHKCGVEEQRSEVSTCGEADTVTRRTFRRSWGTRRGQFQGR